MFFWNSWLHTRTYIIDKGLFWSNCKAMIACLLTAAMTAGLSACSEEDNPAQQSDGTEVETSTEKDDEPTTDQMGVSVTADINAAVLSQFGDNTTGAAFVKRLPTTTGKIDDETRLVLVKGSDALTFPTATIEDMANVILNGGYLAIETPTKLNMAEFAVKFAVALLKKQNEYLSRRFLVDGAQVRMKDNESAEVERLRARLANISNVASTRSTIIDRLKAPMAELLILGSNQYFMQEAFTEETEVQTYAVDNEDNRTDERLTVKLARNGFRNGKMADAAAEWLNEVEEQRTAKALAARAITRADANDAINELMDPSETFTFSGHAAIRDMDNDWFRRSNRVKQVIRSWGVHDMESNKDYYYVKQNITLSMGERDGVYIFYPPLTNQQPERIWKVATNYGKDWTSWYGSFLSKYVTSMELTGSGNIAVEAAMPETKNSGTTTSVSIGTSHSTTTTVGVTLGVTGGYTQVPGWNIGGSLSGSYSKGWTDSRSFNIGYSRTIEDLTVSKNLDGNKVSWTYDANKPKGYVANDIYGHDYSYCHQIVPEILVSDADLLDEICWSVANPDGQYTINIFSQPETAALMKSDKSKKNTIVTKYEYTLGEESNFSHELLQPNRAQQTWRMNIIIDEWENGIVNGAQGEIEQYLNKSYPDLYANIFTIADKTPTSVQVISNFIDYSKRTFDNVYDILQGLAHSYGVKRFTIHWRCDDQNITVKEGYTVDVDAPFVTKATEGNYDNAAATNLFDQDLANPWYVKNGDKQDGVWFVEFNYSHTITPTAYTMWTRSVSNYETRYPTCWKLMAKNSANGSWTVIAEEQDNTTMKGEGKPYTFTLNKVAGRAWQYFRLEVSKNSNDDVMQIGEFNFEFGDAVTPTPADQPAVSFRLDKDADNTELIAHYDGRKANVTLGGRKFFKNGTWNSLVVPFDIDDFAGTPLEGASVRELKSVECSGNTMTLKFSAVAAIKAHKPYIVRWDEGDDLQNPVFNGVTIKNGTPAKVVMTANGNEEVIAFIGVYDPLTLKAKDHNKLFFGADNKLYWPSEDVALYSNYAYFQLYNNTYTNVVLR